MNPAPPIAPAPTDRALDCTRAAWQGVTLAEGPGAIEGRCGCGHPLNATTPAAALEAFRDHIDYRTAQ
jgi:hypothetical protein